MKVSLLVFLSYTVLYWLKHTRLLFCAEAFFIPKSKVNDKKKFFSKDAVGWQLRHIVLQTTPNHSIAVSSDRPTAHLKGYISSNDTRQLYESALKQLGFVVLSNGPTDTTYQFHPATGMLQLVDTTTSANESVIQPPKWIPIVKEHDNVLVANGWSFLDVDESEKLSPFDVDAANLEGLYRPKWGCRNNDNGMARGDAEKMKPMVSLLGYSLDPMTSEQVMSAADSLLKNKLSSRSVLLNGTTDPPYEKVTHNGYSWKGGRDEHLLQGIFTCAIGNLPLFATSDFSPVAFSGWLSFMRPISPDHLVHVKPDKSSMDQRIEVLCARSGCHLGHFFKGDGYCINASALNFWPAEETGFYGHRSNSHQVPFTGPFSYPSLEQAMEQGEATDITLQLLHQVVKYHASRETIVLGAGCFWHVEFAMRRLPGVLDTKVGYAGGKVDKDSHTVSSLPQTVTYEQVCKGDTSFAEAVRVDFDPTVLKPHVLLDCYLALHDPTKVRAHGKHAAETGQYRSCIFLPESSKLLPIVDQALKECECALQKEIVTEVHQMNGAVDDFFYVAEDRHQRHDERGGMAKTSLATLDAKLWIEVYGRRATSILGSASTLDEQIAESRFFI